MARKYTVRWVSSRVTSKGVPIVKLVQSDWLILYSLAVTPFVSVIVPEVVTVTPFVPPLVCVVLPPSLSVKVIVSPVRFGGVVSYVTVRVSGVALTLPRVS